MTRVTPGNMTDCNVGVTLYELDSNDLSGLLPSGAGMGIRYPYQID